jgi:CDP-diacylglycerol--serine O-phosphatidyltransferase
MRSKRKKRAKKTGKKGIYVLPNLFTSASLFSGFFAIIAAIQGRYETAAMAILISCVFDGLDGKIARYTHSTSQFGVEYDSLCDLVAFGVAPALLAFQWALEPFRRLGWLACFMFLICGALRLARFNVQKNTVELKYFRGLPIPAAASFVASLVLFTTFLGGLPESRHILIIVMIYILSFLMVSTIEYPSFKELELKKQKPFSVLVATILILMVIVYKPKVMLFIVLTVYIASGPVITMYRLRKKRAMADIPMEEVSPAERE